MEPGDKIRVKQSSFHHKGEIGTIVNIRPDNVATIRSPFRDKSFQIHTDFLEDHDWADED